VKGFSIQKKSLNPPGGCDRLVLAGRCMIAQMGLRPAGKGGMLHAESRSNFVIEGKGRLMVPLSYAG